MSEKDAGPLKPGSGKEVRFVVQRPLEVDADSEVYNMSRRVRKAVIFNHYTFTHDNLEKRKGTEHDVNRLQTILHLFKFTVKLYQDLNCCDLFQKLENLRLDNHDDCDCLAIFVLSHGKLNKLAAKDEYYSPEKLWEHFSSVACPTMAGKPKLIVINACRGGAYDVGVEFVCDITTDGSQDTEDNCDIMMYHLPNNADMLLAFSTFDGYVSHRRQDEGSWFIKALCDVLMDNKYKKMEIKQLFTRVTHKVALKISSENRKQVPVVVSTLIRDLYLS